MQGLTLTVPTWIGFRPSLFSILRTDEGEAVAWVRQVPKPGDWVMTQSPFVKEEEVVERTSKQPSLPPTADGSGVPSSEVKGGLEG